MTGYSVVIDAVSIQYDLSHFYVLQLHNISLAEMPVKR